MSIAYEPARCAVCGHADALAVAEQDDVRREVEDRWAFHARRLRPGTPTQRLMDRAAFSEPAPLRLVQCRDCGLVYRNPVERTQELTEIYARDSPPPELLQSLFDAQLPTARRQAQRVLAALGRPGAGLEVGSYVGAFLAAAREFGLAMQGVDVNTDVNTFARARGYTVHDGDLGSVNLDAELDVITIWNTFDQVPDPRASLFAASRLLRPGGLLVVRVPSGEFYVRARRQLSSRIAGVRGVARELMAQNNLLGFPYRWGFSATSMSRLLEAAGFELQRIYGDVLVRTADEFTRPWARVEEMIVKRALAAWTRTAPAASPWLEFYARKLPD